MVTANNFSLVSLQDTMATANNISLVSLQDTMSTANNISLVSLQDTMATANDISFDSIKFNYWVNYFKFEISIEMVKNSLYLNLRKCFAMYASYDS